MIEEKVRRVLTIAGSDPSAGAGVQLDLKVFERLGVYGMTVITALTAQNSVGVQKIAKVAPRVVEAQIDSVHSDIGVDACKIGMLYSSATVMSVVGRIRRREIPNVVLDPVLAAKDGTAMLSASGIRKMKRYLIPRALVVTPNVPEAEILSGMQIESLDDLRLAVREIHAMGCGYVLAKGGHLDGEPVDVLFDGEEMIDLAGSRFDGPPVHGTGCAFSAALVARIALGDGVQDAARFAKSFTADLIANAVKLGKGNRLIK
jgi:hydroxymethylpyrimidine/phosphomethylpyrimidine kinase